MRRRVSLLMPPLAVVLAALLAGPPGRAGGDGASGSGEAPSRPPAGAPAPPAAGPPAPAPGSGRTEGACAEEMARRVQRHYESVRDLSADFEQTSSLASLGGPADPGGALPLRGHVVFAKPGRMRWAYREPEESLVVTDGSSLWTWDPAAREAQRVDVGEGFLSGAAIQFLLGEGDLLESFAITSRDCGGERVVLRLEPLEPASYERLVLEVRPRDGRVLATEVTDLFGNVTRVAFSDVRLDTGPDASLFRFEPPEGARVIEVPSAP